MIAMEGRVVKLECDCHYNGHEVTMAKVTDGQLVIISRHHGENHVVSTPLDKLVRLCLELPQVGSVP